LLSIINIALKFKNKKYVTQQNISASDNYKETKGVLYFLYGKRVLYSLHNPKEKDTVNL